MNINDKFGKWTVIDDKLISIKQKTYAKCQCECGLQKYVSSADLKSRKSTKCMKCCNLSKAGVMNVRHGKSSTPIYKVWRAMIERCNLTSRSDYKYYGGRGISVIPSWLSFINFYRDMGDRPIGMQLDRIDNNGNYEPGNCHWVTPKQNSANRRKKGTC